jgi:hypothetical protein
MKNDDLVVKLVANTCYNIICMRNLFSFMLFEYAV